jgi:glycosyltransferase involved in cell wall biosynthesis
MKLSIIIPAFNEEGRIRPTLETYLAYFEPPFGLAFELVVVVNHCTDRTADVVAGMLAEHPQVRLIVEPRRIGKGGAVMLGFRSARGNLVGFTDADGSTPAEAFGDLVRKIGQAGVIIASRWLPQSKVEPPQPLDRRVASRVFNGLVRVFFKLPISDTQCGAKLLRREALDAALPALGLTRWAFDVDLLFHVRRSGFAISEIPTTWQDRAGSKLRIPRASVEMFLAICRLRLLHSPLQWTVMLYDRTLARLLRWPPR